MRICFCISADMTVRLLFRDYSPLSARVAHAYFKYGCYCSSHPIVTILFSIASLLLLSYPLTRLRLTPSATPFEIITADNIDHGGSSRLNSLSNEEKPRSPTAYLQQIVVSSRVNPWPADHLKQADAVKGPLDLAFDLIEKLNSFRYTTANGSNSKGINDYCFRVGSSAGVRFPSHTCLILSPAMLWNNNRQKFYDDGRILDTIFDQDCASYPCTRNLLFGVPDSYAGLKRRYSTNRQRSIIFSVTVVMTEYDEEFIRDLRRYLESDSNYRAEETKNDASPERRRENKFIFIYYLARKDTAEYALLVLSYSLVFAYLYFSVRKIEMVKSKWGLAFSAVFTVAASLAMASGICVNFDLMPRLWKGCIFPYLAMVLGIENTLCITRSVVYTPVTLPVEQRISHGLSREGWLITKNFLIELSVMLLGMLTRIPEIQEFCTLGCIGLVVDFYMQLFFYAPILTFDLLRFDSIEIQRLAVMQQQRTRQPLELTHYPPVHCPVMRMLRAVAPSALSTLKQPTPAFSPSKSVDRPPLNWAHPADVSLNVASPNGHSRMAIPHRVKFMMFWSRYRYCQTVFTVVVVVWIAWLALVVRQWNLIGQLNSSLGSVNYTSNVLTDSSSSSYLNRHSSTKTTTWSNWESSQRTAFRWWPQLFNIYNISLSGQYLVLLPRIALNADISPDKAVSLRSGIESSDQPLTKFGSDQADGGGALDDLGVRISWLEVQMTAVLVMALGLCVIVGGFILYVCFVGGEPTWAGSTYELDASLSPSNSTVQQGRSHFVDPVPVIFSRHKYDVELVDCVGDMMVSVCLGGSIMVWDATSGAIIRQVRPAMDSGDESCPFDHDTAQHTPAVWCMDVQGSIIVAGLSNGDAELYDLRSGISVGLWSTGCPSGITQVRLKGGRLVAARANGQLDFVELRAVRESGGLHCRLLKSVLAHQRRISRLIPINHAVLTASDDHTLRLFDARTFTRVVTFYGHSGPVVTVAVDEAAGLMFSGCSDGLICVWDLAEGKLLRSLWELTFASAAPTLAFTSTLLVAQAPDGSVWLWKKYDGSLVTSMKTCAGRAPNPLTSWRDGSTLIILGDRVAITANRRTLTFWDLERQALLKETRLNDNHDTITSPIRNLSSVGGFGVLCSQGNDVYRLDLPPAPAC